MPSFASRITPTIRRTFLASADQQAAKEGARYAQLGRAEKPVEHEKGLTILVRGESGDYPVTFWFESGRLMSACECPSWRDPCKHQVAALLSLVSPGESRSSSAPRGADRSRPAPAPSAERPDPEVARKLALEERREAGRKGRMQLRLFPEAPGTVEVGSDSGFTYRVTLRGGADGPHSCDCPDFEANRLHACKHVERVRLALASGGLDLSPRDVAAADAPRAYLHLGEIVEPRWFGDRAALATDATLREAFDGVGRWLGPIGDPAALRSALAGLGDRVEPEALAWLDARLLRVPDYGGRDPATLIPPTPLPLHPYQRAGIAFLARSGRALLADEMGLGKTVQAILAAVVMRQAAHPVRAVTIACPASLRGGWQDEIRRWTGEDAVLVEGGAAQRAKLVASRPPWLITHYEQVLRDRAAHHAHPPDLLVIDEAQRAKSLEAVTARALKDVGARHVFALTGTPLENRLEEAYSIAQLIDQRLLPPLWQLERDHVVREEDGRRILAYRGLDALRTRLAPSFLRRRKEDVALELPARVRSVLLVAMQPEAIGSYDDCLLQAARIARKTKLTPPDFEKMQRLLMICRRACDGAHLLRDAAPSSEAPKLVEIENLLRDLALGERRKVVVFSEWTDMTASIEPVAKRLGLPVFSLRGEVAVSARPQLIRAFHSQQGPAVFLSTDAGGLGLNLQAADVVVNVDMPWNPARLEQRLARVHRIGSHRTVHEILLVTAGSLEERMLRLHERKRAALENVWATEGEDVIVAPGARDDFTGIVRELTHRDEAPAPLGHERADHAEKRADLGALRRTLREATQGLGRSNRAEVAALLRSIADELARG